MAIEEKRGCGWRKVGGIYLVGGMIFRSCDRLPIVLKQCPVCGAGIHFSRSIARINPFKLWGRHQGSLMGLIDDQPITAECSCYEFCNCCNPPDALAFIMFVGQKFYTVQEFVQEALSMGVCKRIPAVPDDLEVGKTVVYLAHEKCVKTDEKDENGKPIWERGVFAAFIPLKVEKLIWQKDATPENLAALEKRGITPVVVPDGDPDHAPINREVQRL